MNDWELDLCFDEAIQKYADGLAREYDNYIMEINMDQSDLMQVRNTLDACASGNVDVEDVVTSLELVESYIDNEVPAPVGYTDEVAQDAEVEVSEDDNETS